MPSSHTSSHRNWATDASSHESTLANGKSSERSTNTSYGSLLSDANQTGGEPALAKRLPGIHTCPAEDLQQSPQLQGSGSHFPGRPIHAGHMPHARAARAVEWTAGDPETKPRGIQRVAKGMQDAMREALVHVLRKVTRK